VNRLEAAAAPRALFAAFLAAQAVLVVLGILVTPAFLLLVAAAVAPWFLLSVPRALAASLFLTIVIPTEANRYAVIPFGLDPAGIAVLGALPVIALVVVRIARREFRWRRTSLDLPMAVLLVTIIAAAIRGSVREREGFAYNLELLQWLLFATFFVATQGTGSRRAARMIWNTIIAACAFVGLQYLWISLAAPHAEFGSFSRVTTHQIHVFPLVISGLAAELLSEDRRRRRIAAAVLVPVTIGLLLSQLRSVIVASAFGVLIVMWVCRRRSLTARRVLEFCATVAAVVLVAYLVTLAVSQSARLPFSESLLMRSGEIGQPGRSPAMAIRVITYRLVWDERITVEPLWGSGLGDHVSFPGGLRHFREYGFVDNAYLTAWWKLGLPGLVALGWLIGAGFFMALRTFRRAVASGDRVLSASLAGTFGALAVLGLTTVVPAQMPFNGIWAAAFAIAAMLDRPGGWTPGDSPAERPVSQPPGQDERA